MSEYFTGSAWSQTYAREAMPLLVNFAGRRRSVSYKQLAGLLGNEKYAHPLMSALGRLGRALNSVSEKEHQKFGEIPPIQLLVCNQTTRRPGNLALSFLGFTPSQTARMSKQQLDSLVLAAHQKIFSYERWHEVLKALGLKPLRLSLPPAGNVLPKIQEIERRSTAEGDDHMRLKLFLARNPRQIGIQFIGTGDTEQFLLSGDRLDISFRNRTTWIAVEVKGKQSLVADLIRGIFQCIKYRAVLRAQLQYELLEGSEYSGQRTPRVILACGGALSEELLKLAESLDVEVKSDISVPEDFVP